MKTILLVDDEVDILKILTLRLEAAGYKIETAKNGNEVFEKIKIAKPDLIFIDYFLPGKNGFLVIKELKESLEYKDIPVLLISGAKEKIEEKGLDKLADAVLYKPFNKEELLATIKKII
ncbi:response regulator [Candidatus Margulisiibacteriota bacterium]